MKAAWRKTWDERGKTSRGISGGASSRIAEQCDSKWKEVGNGGNGSGSRGGLGVVEQGHGVSRRKHHQPIKLVCSITAVLSSVNVICLCAWWGNINNKKTKLDVGDNLLYNLQYFGCISLKSAFSGLSALWVIGRTLCSNRPIRFDTQWLIMADRTLHSTLLQALVKVRPGGLEQTERTSKRCQPVPTSLMLSKNSVRLSCMFTNHW